METIILGEYENPTFEKCEEYFLRGQLQKILFIEGIVKEKIYFNVLFLGTFQIGKSKQFQRTSAHFNNNGNFKRFFDYKSVEDAVENNLNEVYIIWGSYADFRKSQKPIVLQEGGKFSILIEAGDRVKNDFRKLKALLGIE